MPLPIIFALSLNELRNGAFIKWSQTLTYAPHFISVVVVVGMLVAFLDPSTGLINHVVRLFGFEPLPFLTSPKWFRHIFVWSGQWRSEERRVGKECKSWWWMLVVKHSSKR